MSMRSATPAATPCRSDSGFVRWAASLLILAALALPAAVEGVPPPAPERATSPWRLAAPDEGDALPEGVQPPPADNLAVPSTYSEHVQEVLNDAIATFTDARKNRSESRIEKAVYKMRDVVRQAKDTALPHYYLGIMYQWTEDFRKARKFLETALRINPDFYEAYVELGDVDVWENKREKAIERYERALEIYPDYEYGIDRMMLVLIQLGHYQEAQPFLERGLKYGSNEMRDYCKKVLALILEGPNWGTTYSVESSNYIVKTNVSQEFGETISENLELIRLLYDALFPDVPKPDQKYPVFVFNNQATYLAAGAPPQSLGFFDPLFKRLMLFQQEKLEDTLMTLRHEGFHQYCDEYVKNIPQWFNEGLADYFAPAVQIPGKKKMHIRPNPHRIGYICQALRQNVTPSVPDLMNMSQAQMYDKEKIFIHYCQAWSLVYFCIDGGNKLYQKTLINYFKALAKGRDQSDTYRLTFGKLDMQRFEQEWRQFTLQTGDDEKRREQ